MQPRRLGRSGLKVSPLCLGTMTFGEADSTSFMHQVGCDEPTAFAIMDRALDAGVNFFDTANVYGQDGLSERVIGRWLAQSKRRDEIVLATKFRFRMGKGPNDAGGSRRHVVAACEASLRRLGTDRIELYQIHMQDLETPEEETLRALDDLVRAGKVQYLGCSNYAAYRMVDSLWTSRHQHLESFVALQANYSLLVRDLEREHVPVCKRFGVGLLPYSPLAAGFLSGKFRRHQPPPAGTRLEKFKERFASFDNDRGWGVVDALRAAATELSTTPSAVALAWTLAKPYVSSTIFGARSVEQLDDNLRAANLTLPAAWVDKLDAASAFDLGYPYSWFKTMASDW